MPAPADGHAAEIGVGQAGIGRPVSPGFHATWQALAWIAWRRIVLTLLIIAAGVCLYLGITEPIIKLTQLYVFSDEHSLVTAVQALYTDGEVFLATVVLIFSIVMPTLKLGYLLVLACLPTRHLGDRHRTLQRLEWLGKWSMHDVLILSLTIVYLRAEGVSQAASMPGARYFAASVILIMIAYGWVKKAAREALPKPGERTMALRALRLPNLSGPRRFVIVLLTVAGAVTLGLGVLLPAIRLTKLYLWTDTHSIVSAIWALFSEGEYFLAGIIFLFSVLVPALKLFYLLVVATVTSERPDARDQLLARLEGLGKWSMMDVLVLALVIFYVNASAIADASALPGVYCFAASVFLTMLAYALVKGGLSPRPSRSERAAVS